MFSNAKLLILDMRNKLGTDVIKQGVPKIMGIGKPYCLVRDLINIYRYLQCQATFIHGLDRPQTDRPIDLASSMR